MDDDKLIRETYQSVLTTAGYEVEVSEDLPTTERILKHFIPDFLLLDLMMKPKSGWEILDHIRENPSWQDIPIIIFSGKVVYAHEIRRYGEQVIGYIRKPTRLPEIITEINRVSSCQKETQSLGKKASIIHFSDQELVEFRNLLLNNPVLDLLASALQRNFRTYLEEGNQSDQVHDPEMETLHLWIEEKRRRLERFMGRTQ